MYHNLKYRDIIISIKDKKNMIYFKMLLKKQDEYSEIINFLY